MTREEILSQIKESLTVGLYLSKTKVSSLASFAGDVQTVKDAIDLVEQHLK